MIQHELLLTLDLSNVHLLMRLKRLNFSPVGTDQLDTYR